MRQSTKQKRSRKKQSVRRTKRIEMIKMEIVKIEGLTKIYGKGTNQVVALENIHFTVEKGDFVAIVGASGSGKSTLLHIIGGVDSMTSGKVFVDNQDISTFKEEELANYRREKVGLIYQFYNLIPVLNGRENIILPLSLGGKKIDEDFFNEITSFLKIEDRLNHLPNELSGGEQQRIAIARALFSKPAILLADEATGNLDSTASLEILEYLKRSNEEYGQTIIMVTHDDNLAKFAKRIITMKDGKIVADERVQNDEDIV